MGITQENENCNNATDSMRSIWQKSWEDQIYSEGIDETLIKKQIKIVKLSYWWYILGIDFIMYYY